MLEHEVSDSVRDDARFPAPRPGKDQDCTIAVGHGLTLRFVKSFEEFSLGGDGLHCNHSIIRSLALSISASPARKTCVILATQGSVPTKGIDCICS